MAIAERLRNGAEGINAFKLPSHSLRNRLAILINSIARIIVIRIPHILLDIIMYVQFLVCTFGFSFICLMTLRPHRSKLFFSYSHRDAKQAEAIMSRLKKHHFRVWIDFDKELEESELKETLGRLIEKHQIVVLLGSRNSINSEWVRFELAEAATEHEHSIRASNWRDIIFVALDDYGVHMYETIQKQFQVKQNSYELDLQGNIKELDGWLMAFPVKSLRYKILKIVLDQAQSFASKMFRHPSMRRLVTPVITLIDVRLSYDSAIDQLTQCLSDSSKSSVYIHPLFNTVKYLVILFWLIGMMWAGGYVIPDLIKHFAM